MHSDLSPIHHPGLVSSRSRRRVPVVAVHDGAASAARVAQAREQMEQMIGEAHPLRFYSWAFHHLEALDVRAMAGHVAEAAPLILLASEDGRPPEHVERWLDQSLIEQENQRALLVALADREDPLCTFTGQLAARWRTQHLCVKRLDLDPQREWVLNALETQLRPEIPAEAEVSLEAHDMPLTAKTEAPAPTSWPMVINEPHLREEIRMRAYHLWLHAGRPLGQELDFWLRAEREFLDRQSGACSDREQQHW